MTPENFELNGNNNEKERDSSAFDIIITHFGSYEELFDFVKNKIEGNKIEGKELTEIIFSDYPDKEVMESSFKTLNQIVNGIAEEIREGDENDKEKRDSKNEKSPRRDSPKLSDHEYFINYGEYPDDGKDKI